MSEFKSFVTAVGTRYSGTYRGLPRVTFWSIWNEPNYGISLAPQATNHDTIEVGAWSYRNIVDAAWSALHTSGHGRDTILIGETAPRGLDHPIGNYSGVKPLRFLRALYCVDSSYRPLGGSAAKARGCPTTSSASARFRSQHPALFQASGFSDHPYAQGFSPSTLTYACSGSKVCGSHTRSDPDYADFAVLPRLERTLDRLNRVYGSRTQFPIWSTEYGYWTNPPDKAATSARTRLRCTSIGRNTSAGASAESAATPSTCSSIRPWGTSPAASSSQAASPSRHMTRIACPCSSPRPRVAEAVRSRSGVPSAGALRVGKPGRRDPVPGRLARLVADRTVARDSQPPRLLRHACRVPRQRIGADRLAGSARWPDSQSHRQDHAALARPTAERYGSCPASLAPPTPPPPPPRRRMASAPNVTPASAISTRRTSSTVGNDDPPDPDPPLPPLPPPF